ncbi:MULTISPECIES: pentapeptide repeat-containing protein [unclassified Yoonia]|uniref:pentapeptide repeat-containing protein n=1 Tax=unclassified Yoonia TaxID=2629118 RepID=UPI002B000B56|nr:MULTISPECIES: pentapeptide repeat-containing protein [unclassified Yoonia]
MPRNDQRQPTLLDWLALRQTFDWLNARPLGGFLGFLGVLFSSLLVIAACWTLILFFVALVSDDPNGEGIRNIGLVLVALLGGPFLVWRSYVAAQQANTAVEALFNDKINAAATDLASRRQVTRATGSGKSKRVLTYWEDDLVTRAAAIDRLTDLSKEQPREALRVVRILSAYLRGTFPVKDLDPSTVPFTRAIPRIDKQAAITAIGQVHEIARETNPGKWRLDLRRCDLDGADFTSGNFFAADFSQSRIEAARFRSTDLNGALLRGCLLNFSDFSKADMTGAKLDHCILNRPEPISGGMCYSINLANFKGMTFINADISAIDYLGEPEELATTFGTADTKHSLESLSVMPNKRDRSRAANLFYLDEETLTPAQKQLVESLVATGFQYWSPHNHEDMATMSYLARLYRDLDLQKWPYWEN